MKVAIITDQHFGARSDSRHFLDFYERFYKETFFPTIESHGINTLLILGDTFDRRKYINFYTLKRAKEMFFDKLAELNIKVHMLAGNHDTYFKNMIDVNSVDLLLREYDNINVIDSPQTIHLNYEDESCDVCMIPWICENNYENAMSEIKNTSADMCMGHFEIAGFAMHRGMISEGGLSRDGFKRFSSVFSGHYHHRSTEGNITYLGNPYELTWNDYDDMRGFHIFDLSTRNLDFIKNDRHMFYRIIYDDIKETVLDITNKDLTNYTNTYVKVVVINKTNPYLFDQFMNNLENVNPIDITIVEDYVDLTENMNDEIDQTEDTVTIINKFIDAVENKNIDNGRLKNVLKMVYVEALNLEKI